MPVNSVKPIVSSCSLGMAADADPPVHRPHDNPLVHAVGITAANQEEFHKPFHIVLNLALAGQFPGA